MQRAHVDSPLEIHHLAHRRPIISPAPAIEFGLVGQVEAQFRFLAGELQQIPALLLADAAVAHILAGQTVAQPALRRSQHLDILALQTYFFLELAIQRVLHRLAAIDAALGELPTAPTDASTQKYFPRAASENDADIGAESVLVDVVGGGLDGHLVNCSISPGACA